MRSLVFTFLVLTQLAGPAFAGGYFLPGGGAEALGRAGASVVSAEDASLFWYNPARLAALPGTRLLLSGGAVFAHMSFLRYPPPEVPEQMPPVENSAPPAPSAIIGISSDFGLESLVFGLAFYTPSGVWNRYPEDGPQRYSEVRAENMAWWLEAAAAWEPAAGLRLGAGFTLFSLHINHTYAVSAFSGIFGLPEDRDLDAMVQSLAKKDFIPGGTAGLWLHLGQWLDALDGLELGLSFSSGMAVSASGRLRIRLPDHIYYDQVTVDPAEPPVMVKLNLPWVVRFGARYRREGLFDIELDTVWEGWSATRDVKTILQQPTYYRDVPAMGDYRLNDTISPRLFTDTWSVRLGGSVEIIDWLTARAGFLWESGATPEATYSVANPDAEKYGVGLGVTLSFGPWLLDLGYLHLFQAARDVRLEESRVTQTNPANPEDTTIVGAGRYSSGYDLLGAGLRLRLDTLWK